MERTKKLGHGWAPDSETRQKDRTRTKLRATRQRTEMTPSEKKLWDLLRSIEGHTFRRQVAIGDYVFDFGNYASRLLIEIDGSIHRLPDVQQNDKQKTVYAIAEGFRILRLANNDVWDRPAWVIAEVCRTLLGKEPPLPCGEGVGGEGRANAQQADHNHSKEQSEPNRAPTRDVGALDRPSPPNPLSARERGNEDC